MQKIILIVDSHEEVFDVMQLILGENKYKVVPSRDDRIMEDILSYKPDLILLDDWPLGSGVKTCRILKNDHNTRHISIILTSTNPRLSKVAFECGADDFLDKPFDIDDFERVIELTLEKKQL